MEVADQRSWEKDWESKETLLISRPFLIIHFNPTRKCEMYQCVSVRL